MEAASWMLRSFGAGSASPHKPGKVAPHATVNQEANIPGVRRRSRFRLERRSFAQGFALPKSGTRCRIVEFIKGRIDIRKADGYRGEHFTGWAATNAGGVRWRRGFSTARRQWKE
jgi:hypothetical protein